MKRAECRVIFVKISFTRGTAIFSRVHSRVFYEVRVKAFRCPITAARLQRKFGHEASDRKEIAPLLRQKLRERFFLSDLNRKEFYINLLTTVGDFDSIMDDADLVHENKYRTSGSDLYSYGAKVDWCLDFKSGKRWDRRSYSGIDVAKFENSSDVKVPWEVNRFHQAIWLGKAYWLSRSEAHTEKFKELASDWIENNPVGYGVNWTSPTEAAIRAINIITGLLYFMGSTRLNDEFVMKLLCSLYEHGVFIRYNLEKKLGRNNDLVANLVGLVYIGILFYDAKSGKRWLEFARKKLEREIANRVWEDGTVCEISTSYQRLATEMFTAAYVLLKLNKFKISSVFSSRLEKMFAFLASATMHDGRVPNIGTVDGGPILRMKSNTEFNDHRDLLSVGAALFGRGDLKAAAGGFSELALLLLGGEGFESFSLINPENRRSSSIYKKGGFAFMRTERDYCSFDFGNIGTHGRIGHGHNDILSFTVAGKNPFIVDRGTLCYTSDTIVRNELRSTYSHNTVIVDGAEQAEFAGPWSVRADLPSSELLEWNSTPEQDIIEAQHHAYERLNPAVTHRRKITFNKRQRTFLVQDNLLGTGSHTVEMMFHFAPELKVVDLGRNFLALEGEEFALMKFQQPFALEEWQHSPGCGVLQAARTARVRLQVHLPARIETFIFIISSADDMNHLLNRIQSVGPPE